MGGHGVHVIFFVKKDKMSVNKKLFFWLWFGCSLQGVCAPLTKGIFLTELKRHISFNAVDKGDGRGDVGSLLGETFSHLQGWLANNAPQLSVEKRTTALVFHEESLCADARSRTRRTAESVAGDETVTLPIPGGLSLSSADLLDFSTLGSQQLVSAITKTFVKRVSSCKGVAPFQEEKACVTEELEDDDTHFDFYVAVQTPAGWRVIYPLGTPLRKRWTHIPGERFAPRLPPKKRYLVTHPESMLTVPLTVRQSTPKSWVTTIFAQKNRHMSRQKRAVQREQAGEQVAKRQHQEKAVPPSVHGLSSAGGLSSVHKQLFGLTECLVVLEGEANLRSKRPLDHVGEPGECPSKRLRVTVCGDNVPVMEDIAGGCSDGYSSGTSSYDSEDDPALQSESKDRGGCYEEDGDFSP